MDTLTGDGPFTLLAPTDEAFAKISKDRLDDLLEEEDALIAVLTYHPVPGKVKADDVAKLLSAKTIQGQYITVDTSDGVTVENARVIKTDIEAGNGAIHVVDTEIMPN